MCILLYLFHGRFEVESDWVGLGRAGLGMFIVLNDPKIAMKNVFRFLLNISERFDYR